MDVASQQLAVIILAAGKGIRMKSDLAKVLHPLGGRAMIHYVVDAARRLKAEPIVVIVGYQKERVIRELGGQSVRFAVQEPQLGTGHAVMCALPELREREGSVLILSGDVPFIRAETLKRLWVHHCNSQAAATVLTARIENPRGYGRIVRHPSGNLEAIIEERDASHSVRRITEINGGIYIFELDDLRAVLPHIRDDNDQREYYLTDAVRLLTAEGKTVAALEGNFREVMGINTIAELKNADKLVIQGELLPRGDV